MILYFIFVFAFILRIIFSFNGAITFGYDQARDAFIANQILAGDLKILGPPTSTPGLFHGVFYYYYLAVAYFFGKNPLNALIWNSITNSFVIFLVYKFSLSLFSNKKSAPLASILFAISFEATQYSIWISNPTIAIFTIPLTYFGLWSWTIKNKNWGAIVSGLFFGLSIQSNFFLGFHFLAILIWLLICKSNLKLKNLFNFFVSLLIGVSSMILVEFKFGFKSVSGILNLLTSKDSLVSQKGLGDFIVLFFNQTGRLMADNLFPLNQGYGGVLGFFFLLILLGKFIKSKNKNFKNAEIFLTLYLFSHLSVISVGGVSTPNLTVGISIAVVIISAEAINRLLSIKSYKLFAQILIVLIFVTNIYSILTKNKNGSTIFPIQKGMILREELKAIDFVYQNTNSNEFSVNTITNPLWVNTTWSYLFNWYGIKNYGYLPYWHGKGQIGQLGNNLNEYTNENQIFVLITESPKGIPGIYLEEFEAAEKGRGELIQKQIFGDIEVEIRHK